jgi:acyl-CoA synthetase (AMP-forming)/AMP-acid ligase II
MTATIIADIAAVAGRTPDAPALSWHDCTWTYAELERAIGCVQRKLADLHLPRGARVPLLVRNSPQYAALYYGVMAAGHVAVPLNTAERAGVLARQVGHAEPSVIFADVAHPEWPAFTEAIAGHEGALLPLEIAGGTGSLNSFCETLGNGSGPAIADNVAESSLAMILYTSGTTALPKGVMLSHGNLAANARAIVDYLEIEPADKVLCMLPFQFSYGTSVLNSNLRAGAHLFLEDNFAFPHLVLKHMEQEGITGFPGVPSTFALLLGRCRLEEFDLRRLRYITQAGGPMPKPHIQQLHAGLPHTKMFIMYGQTEATARLTYLPPDKLDAKLGSVGVPLPGVEIEIRDERRPVPVGEVGEICARGPNVMLGYWRQPDLSSMALRSGWLHTGDLGHLDGDGYLYIDGRTADMIKVGAFRVSPQEVEEVIASYPGVEEVGVAGVEDAILGQTIKALVVMRAGSEGEAQALKAHCRHLLAAFKVPKVIEFTTALPR